VKVGILEFRDNAFIRSVVSGLAGVETEFIKVGEVSHPAPSPFSLIVDRVSFCDPYLRQLMRYWSIAGTYVLNNPFFTLVYDKLSELILYDRLGIPHARTAVLPRVNKGEDVREMVAEPDWSVVGELVGFPCILKPADGYAWQDVFTVESAAALRSLYESLKETRTLLVQQLVPYVAYFRAFCVGSRETLLVRWNPLPFDMGQYAIPAASDLLGIQETIREKTVALNAALGLDFNAVEWCVTAEGTPVVIDSYNDVPDVRPEKLPPACYDWVVDRFCACIREKLASGARNSLGSALCGLDPRSGLHPGSTPG
jgi:hypothetical protein